MKLRYSIFLFLVVLFFKLSAQNQQIGVSVGSGNTYITSDYSGEKNFFTNPFSTNSPTFYIVGVDYLLKVKSTIFKLKTGLFYTYRNLNNTMVKIQFTEQIDKLETSLITVPLGVDFVFGKSLNVIYGVGMNFNYLVNSTISNDIKDEFKSSKNDFQIGFYTVFGLSYIPKIRGNTNFEIVLAYQNNHDITAIYSFPVFSKFGSSGQTKIKGHDGFVSLNLLFYIKDIK